MIPDKILILVIGFVTFICLLLFVVPVYFIWRHPRIDDADIRRLNSIGIVSLCLPFFSLAAIYLFLEIYEKTGSPLQAIVSLAMIGVITGIVVTFSGLTGMRLNALLGLMAGMVFCGIWMYLSNLLFA